MPPEKQNELLPFQQDMTSDRPAPEEWEKDFCQHRLLWEGKKKDPAELKDLRTCQVQNKSLSEKRSEVCNNQP